MSNNTVKMGAGLPPLEFTECMSDSPSFRENLHKHEKELDNTSTQIKRLIKEVKDLLQAAKLLSDAQRSFSKSLQSFSFQCIGGTQTDDELVIARSLQEFGSLIGRIEDERDMMLSGAYDHIVSPLEKFRKEHIGGVKNGKKKFDKQTAKFCASQERYLNLTNKKQNAVLQEADASVDMAERHFYHASMEYVCLIQEVQERKKFEFVETLLSFMFGWLTFYHQGHEVAKEFKPYMNDLQLKIQKTRTNFQENSSKLRKKMTEVQKQYQESEPILSTKGRKEGYLFLLEKKAFGNAWTKHFCTYDKVTKDFTMMPYNQLTTKTVTPPDKMALSSCVRRMSETIEKRFCFDLQIDQRPGVVYTFQALSDSDRKSWMDIMDGKEPMYVQQGKVPNAEEHVLDETGVQFVKKCIDILERRGLEEQGLYRVVGVTSKVTKLLSMGLDRRKSEKNINFDDPLEWESKTITSALKSYLRNLPEPLMTHRFHNGFIAAVKNETRQQRVNDVHTLIYRIPKQNLEMLRIILKHLTNVAAKCDKNLMTVSNLGVCFGPTLLRPEEETVASIMDLKFYNIVVEILIENYDTIFNSPPERGNSPQSLQHSLTNITNNGRRSPTPTNNGRPHVPSMNLPRMNNSPLYSMPPSQGIGFGPTTYNISTSLRNVHDPSNGGQNIYGTRSDHPVQLPPNYRFTQPRFTSPGIGALSESNLTNMHPHMNNLTAQIKYGSRPEQNSTSSSSESLSSTSREGNNHNHINHYISPEKTKRTNVGTGYPKVYRSQGSIRVRTLYACLGENDGELSFEPNQIITNVKSSQEPGWLEGTLNGKTGLVPENYVEMLP